MRTIPERFYHLANIRKLLIRGFSDDELRDLCFDVPDFRPVYDKLAANTGKAEIVAKLLIYAEETLRIDILLALAKEHNPARYKEHQPYYSTDLSLEFEIEDIESKQKDVQDTRQVLLFDEGHGQHRWDFSERPLLNFDYAPLSGAAVDLGMTTSSIQFLDLDTLKLATVLVIVIPRDVFYSTKEIRDVQTFVRTGGGLLALSYYLGDKHHHTNLNELLSPFGIETKQDRVRDEKSSCETEFHLIAHATPNNPILKEDEKIYMPLSCSLQLKPGSLTTEILQSSSKGISEKAEIVIDGIARSFTSNFEGRQVLGALATYGRGRVAILGSWQTFTISSLEKKDYMNRQLLQNLLHWLNGGTV